MGPKTAAFFVVALVGCGEETVLVTPEMEACVRAKEAQAIAEGRVAREGPGVVNDWAQRESDRFDRSEPGVCR
jgi:hypothetical protein